VALQIACQSLDQPIALMGPSASGLFDAGVGFVDDHKVGAGAEEFVATPVRLDEVSGDNDKGMFVEKRSVLGKVTF
jgi:hypothetical protein